MGTLSFTALLLWTTLIINLGSVSAVYLPLRQYAGQTFFDDWDYYNLYDNTTWGNVSYVDRQTAMSTGLTYINPAGNAVVKVDNVTNVQNGPLVYRNSIRLTSKDTYGVGTLIMIDVRHIPFGCSVWPSFWTLGSGKEWPEAGEIDIIEGINMMDHNQVVLHTLPGCFQAENPGQTGVTAERDCSTVRGCLVAETKPNSFGPAFAQAGGGVWATQIDVSGIYVWFWSRPDIPENVRNATSSSSMDTAFWGPPTASYPSATCDLTRFFTPQHLILLITLCGEWAGIPEVYANTCHTPTMSCFADNIIGPGSPTYDNAFWEISWIRTYMVESAFPASGTATSTSTAPVSTNFFPNPQTSAVQPTASADVGLVSIAIPSFVALLTSLSFSLFSTYF